MYIPSLSGDNKVYLGPKMPRVLALFTIWQGFCWSLSYLVLRSVQLQNFDLEVA